MSRRKISTEENKQFTDFVLEHCLTKTHNDISRLLKMNYYTFVSRVNRLKLAPKIKQAKRNYRIKLARQIDTYIYEGLTNKQIAKKMNLTVNQIQQILSKYGVKTPNKRARPRRTPLEKMKAQMMATLALDFTYSEIAEAFNCSKQNVHQIVTKEFRCL